MNLIILKYIGVPPSKRPFSYAPASTRAAKMGQRIAPGALAVVILVCLLTVGCVAVAFADGFWAKGRGTLTSVDTDGMVYVDGGGYFVDSNARIVNAAGKSCALDNLTLPTVIDFEFVNSSKGPVIKRIKEVPR